MAKITKEETLLFATVAEAVAFARNADGRVRFQVFVRAELPIEGEPGRAFPGSTCLVVSRKDFCEVLRGIGITLVDKRGGRIQLKTSPADRPGGLCFISLW
jgi:hypothetical protein